MAALLSNGRDDSRERDAVARKLAREAERPPVRGTAARWNAMGYDAPVEGGPPRESGCGTCRLETQISNRRGMRKLGFMGALGALAATAMTVAATAMAATT